MAQAARAMVVEEKARAADMASAKQADDISAKARQGVAATALREAGMSARTP